MENTAPYSIGKKYIHEKEIIGDVSYCRHISLRRISEKKTTGRIYNSNSLQ